MRRLTGKFLQQKNSPAPRSKTVQGSFFISDYCALWEAASEEAASEEAASEEAASEEAASEEAASEEAASEEAASEDAATEEAAEEATEEAVEEEEPPQAVMLTARTTATAAIPIFLSFIRKDSFGEIFLLADKLV